MSADVKSREAILRAISEFDAIGRSEFLSRYGFRNAKKYLLAFEGRLYEAKAILGVAYGFEHPNEGPLKGSDFRGDRYTVKLKLESLGFNVVEKNKGESARESLLVNNGSTSKEYIINQNENILREGRARTIKNNQQSVEKEDYETSEDHQYIGYLSVQENPSGYSYSQVLFLVDENGYPIDYSYTDKLTVNETQRILFGTTLRHYLITKVFGTQLLDEIANKPSIIFVDSEDLLAIRENIEIPVFYLDLKERNENGEIGLVTNKNFSNDRVKAKDVLETCEGNFDISEPFSRITEAITKNEDTSKKV